MQTNDLTSLRQVMFSFLFSDWFGVNYLDFYEFYTFFFYLRFLSFATTVESHYTAIWIHFPLVSR